MSRVKPRPAGGFEARYLLLGSTLALCLFGIVMVYSASSVADIVKLDDAAYHFKRQVLYVVFGLFAMLAAWRVDYRKARSPLLLLGLVLLADALLVVVFPLGVVLNGARSWLIVAGVSVQPSEIAKLVAVVAMSALLASSTDPDDLKDITRKLIVVIGPMVLLILAQPDFGMTMSLLLAVFVTMVLAGVSKRVLALLGGAGFSAAAAFVAYEWVTKGADSYRIQRFTAFLNPEADPLDAGYQIRQALYAFGSGALKGVGLGFSRQKYFYLPEAHNDFIFAIVGEELGLIGTLGVVVAFGLMAYAGFRIAMGATDRFGALLAASLTSAILLQALMNMAAVTGLMPVTGITLPLVSSGGSSMLVTLTCIGVILSVSQRGAAVRPVRVRRRADAEEGVVANIDQRRRDRGAHLPRAHRGGRAARGRT